MSVKLMSQVWESAEDISHAKLLVLLKLADCASDEGYCWPSQSTIARQCRLHRVTVNDVISELQREGKLVVTHREGTSNIYQLRLGVPVAVDYTPLSPETTPPVVVGYTNHKLTVNKPSSNTNRVARKKRLPKDSTTIPVDFTLTDSMREWFREKIPAGFSVEEEFEAFVARCTAKGTVYKDWTAGWRTQMLNVPKFNRPNNGYNNGRKGNAAILAEYEEYFATRRASSGDEDNQQITHYSGVGTYLPS